MTKKQGGNARSAARAAKAGASAARASRATVPVEAARRRLRAGAAVLGGGVAAAVVVPSLLERFGVMRSGAWVPALFAGLALALGCPLLYMDFGSVRHGSGRQLLTARTVTGDRTVDLSRLTRIRRVRVLGRAGWLDQVWIKDGRGVALLVDGEALTGPGGPVGPMGRATAHGPGVPNPPSGVKISRHAAAGLGLRTPSTAQRAARAWADALLGILLPAAVTALTVLAAAHHVRVNPRGGAGPWASIAPTAVARKGGEPFAAGHGS
ncbi:hypothetical protein VSR01_11270 [Actinacidiphila sp. DG2A-62]|uniref:hypothetical protein n=1 Tax=Actinacidiphila sp. DG2A-62 TaxID=3108821 RepID=UPI002DB88593|nr:hypothetical protein [Actinacidiphila sp. DG2A-62]MEC3994095.1 hypothetical protein [Actinacidiphila sp. DG2A-62]